MSTPDLRQFAALQPRDFTRCPVWIGCHLIDVDEPWYEDTDEETFRPWVGRLPVSIEDGTLLVRTTFTLADGTRHLGFCSPVRWRDRKQLGALQPHLAVGSRFIGFWGGAVGPLASDVEALRHAIGCPDRAFPIRFAADRDLTQGRARGVIRSYP